ncbi:MAG: NrdH-redoxin [Chloroflexales bacterium]|nr:NrdH-redoxin [Chloroflexales bacterium]
MTIDQAIVIYGTSWCSDCRRAQRVLEQSKVPFTYVNIEEDEAAADYVIRVNNGYRSVPTIIFPDGAILVEPSNLELQKKLVR